jgi:uracil-DNA glycosylase
MQARERRIRIPLRHWTMCHNLAKKLIAHREVQKWKDYVLMEAIHCFYNRENDLNRVQRAAVAETCFNKHTRNMLLFLKPKMIVLLGDIPYELLNQLEYLGKLDVCKFCRIKIKGEIDGKSITLHIPVMRHRAPNFYGRFYCDDKVYEAFREFAGFNGAQP